jgi:exonuclease VII large subunit
MSETTETEATPAVEPTPAPSPESPPTEAAEQTPEEQRDKEDRRIAQLRARLGAAEREREAQRAELEFYRRQVAAQAPADETPEQRAMRERAAIRAEVEAQIRTETFHQQGAAAYGDWKQKCDDLVAMGADPGFAQLLVEMPDGVKVAAALAGDPSEVQRIANLRSERARAVALGKYAATIEGDTPSRPATAAPVTRAPAPIRPVTGRAAPTFNEYSADAQTLVDRYMKENLERQVRR